MDSELREKGLSILGFPCNQFGAQEPGTPAEIKEFVKQYDVKFQLFEKIEVNGVSCHPIYNFLRRNSNLHMIDKNLTELIPWNFAKFILDKDGQVIRYAHPKEEPNSLRQLIDEELGK